MPKDDNPDRLQECRFCQFAALLTMAGLLPTYVCRNEGENCHHFGHVVVGDHGCGGWVNKPIKGKG